MAASPAVRHVAPHLNRPRFRTACGTSVLATHGRDCTPLGMPQDSRIARHRPARLRNPNQCLSQGGDVGISAIRHTYQHMHSRTPRLNPLARGVFNMAGCDFSPATVMRAAALQSKSMRFLASYGPGTLNSSLNPTHFGGLIRAVTTSTEVTQIRR